MPASSEKTREASLPRACLQLARELRALLNASQRLQPSLNDVLHLAEGELNDRLGEDVVQLGNVDAAVLQDLHDLVDAIPVAVEGADEFGVLLQGSASHAVR